MNEAFSFLFCFAFVSEDEVTVGKKKRERAFIKEENNCSFKQF